MKVKNIESASMWAVKLSLQGHCCHKLTNRPLHLYDFMYNCHRGKARESVLCLSQLQVKVTSTVINTCVILP
jgi:hypothetical protein